MGGGRAGGGKGRMLLQLEDVGGTQLDLWLSPNYTRQWPALRGVAGGVASGARRRRAGGAAGGGDAAEGTQGGRGGGGGTAAARNALNVPVVFVGYPARKFICPVCRDVFLDPVVATVDGITYCRPCVPMPEGVGEEYLAQLGEDVSVARLIFDLPCLCFNSLVRKENDKGATLWVFNPTGCSEVQTMRTVEGHKKNCTLEVERCGLPGPGYSDTCSVRVRKNDLEKHRAACKYRLVPCRNRAMGCPEFSPLLLLNEHMVACPFGKVECPNRNCRWRGNRSDLLHHREKCPHEQVVCGLEDSEKQGQTCQYTCLRHELLQHQDLCEFQQKPCEFCGQPVSALHRKFHMLKTCPERQTLCGDCGRTILARRLSEHQALTCPETKLICPYSAVGCTERHSRVDMARHEREDSYKHLRLLTIAVESMMESFRSWEEDCRILQERSDGFHRDSQENVASLKEDRDRVIFSRDGMVDSSKRALINVIVNHEEEVRTMTANFRSELARMTHSLEELEGQNQILSEAISASLVQKVDAEAHVADIAAMTEAVAAQASTIQASHKDLESKWEDESMRERAALDIRALRMEEQVEALNAEVAEYASGAIAISTTLWENIMGKTMRIVGAAEQLREQQTQMEEKCNQLNDHLRRPTVGLTAHMADSALGLTAGPNIVAVRKRAESQAARGERERAIANQQGIRQHAIDKVEARLAAQAVLKGPRGPPSPARLDERTSVGWDEKDRRPYTAPTAASERSRQAEGVGDRNGAAGGSRKPVWCPSGGRGGGAGAKRAISRPRKPRSGVNP